MANREWSMAELQSKAQAYCAAAEHCPQDLQQKIYQWGGTAEQANTIIASLKSDGFMDEQRYCNAFVHDKLLYQGWGRVKLRAALSAKRLPENCIDEAIKNIDETDYFSVLQRLVAQKKGVRPEQAVRFLLQRGFTFNEIHRFVDF